ncbi:MAG: 3-oxoacyl-[acyl-carrier-protein] reductase [Thermincolia bacterium]
MVLKDRVAIITGASRGIGRAVALELAKEGAKVVINYAGNAQKAQEVVDAIRGFGGVALAIQADVSSHQEVESMIDETVKHFGQVDILVNNAGITRDNLLMRMKEEDWDAIMATNLKGVFNCTKAVIRGMMKHRWGRVINITSVIGLIGNAGQANYAAAKAGIIGFTKSIAKELGSRNINVNAIAPGFIDTDMTAVLGDELKNSLLEQIPLSRLGSPEDVANLVVFLASDAASYITGQTINVDGGLVMS